MHSVTTEPTTVDTVVEQNVTIIAIIMPAFQIFFILKVLFELKEDILAVRKVINEKTRSVSEVNIWTNKGRCTNTDTIAYWSFFFCIYTLCNLSKYPF